MDSTGLDKIKANYSSDKDFDKEENQASLSYSPSNSSHDSYEVRRNRKRRKIKDGNKHAKQKKVRYYSSPSDMDSDKKGHHSLRYPSSSSDMDSDKKGHHPLRSDVKTNLYKVSFPGYKNMITQSCQSTGKETIYNFVKRIFQMPGNIRRKPNLEKMVFCNANGECLNVGRPVGLLSTEETYKCYFRSKCRAFDPSHLCRQYAVEDYSSDWNLSYFQVLCSEGKIAPGVSDLTKTNITKMTVDFFNDETIFEALVRDNRFKEEKLRSCGATFNQTQISLSVNAIHIQYKDIEIVSLNEKDSKLPEAVSPRTRPKSSVTATSTKPKQRKQENTSATCSALPGDSSTPVSARPSRKTRDEFVPLLKITYDKKCKKLTVGKHSRQVMKKRISENFALKQGYRGYVSEHEDLIKIAQSVGAIFKLDLADHPRLVGTCFRIGEEYIITNYHVVDEIENIAKHRVYVNFNFKKAGQADSERSIIEGLVVWSTELDYAILRMEKPHEQLPPSIFAHGVSIMNPECSDSNWSLLRDKPLRLIGHPQGEPKQIDLMCTVSACPQSGLECWCYALRRGEEFEGEAVKDYRKARTAEE